MKGCLKIFLLIFVFATLLVLVIGGFCCYNFNTISSQVKDDSPSSIMTRSNSIIPIKENDQFQPVKAIDFMGVRAGVFSDVDTAQYTAILDTGWLLPIKSDNLDEELSKENLEQLIDQSGEKNVQVEKIDVVKKGKVKVNGKEIPYTQLKATAYDTARDKKFTMEGAVGVIHYKDKNILFISGTPNGQKYHHNVTEDFLKTLDLS